MDQPCDDGGLGYGGLWGLLYGGVRVANIDFCKKVVYKYSCIILHGTVIIINH